MISIYGLRDAEVGRPAVVLGGGPSLAADLKRAPAGALLISANHHGLQFAKADYLVFLDDPLRHPELLQAIQSFEGLKLSRRSKWTDIILGRECRSWTGQLSGHVAAWLGCWLGCEPVWLCGRDCYQDPAGQRTRHANRLANLNGWRKLASRCEHPERIRAASGPLVAKFGKS
jgi:hypothetical protein